MKHHVRLLWLLTAMASSPHVQAEQFDIVHIGDVHLGTVSARGVDHMTTWVNNNQVSRNIKLMSQTGDIVNLGTDNTAFTTAANSFLTPLLGLAGNMAIGMSTGNHDYASYVGSVPQSHGDSIRWRAKFGEATWLPYQSTWYAGKSPEDESHVQTFTVGGYTFLNISLEWFHSNSSTTWLKNILDANPDKPTIISTHSYLVPWVGQLRRVSPEGDSVWAVIKNYPQVFLVLSGHVWDTTVDGSVATRTVTNTKGSQLMETVCDFQNCSPSRGWVRLFNIDTSSTSGNIQVTTIATDTGAADTTDNFTWSLDFANRFGPPIGGDDVTPPSAPTGLAGTATANSSLLSWLPATDPAPSSGIKGYDVDRGTAGSVVFVTGTSFDVTELAASTLYTFRVQAIDNGGNRSAWSSIQVTTQAAGVSSFVMGINLNGNAVTIGSNAWLSYANALSNGLSVSPTPLLASTSLTPSPAADTDTNAMLNSAIYAQGNWTLSQTLTNGTYEVYFWVMENYQSNYRNFNIQLEGANVATGIGNMAKSSWAKYGPYRTVVSDGQLTMGVVKITGDPHLMGVAIFRVTLDTEVPSTPANAVATAQSSSSILVTWDVSTDNVAVTGYDVYRNGTLVDSPATTSFTDTGLTASTLYGYTVKAKDAAGNASDFSAAASATTAAAPIAGTPVVYQAENATFVGLTVVTGAVTYLDANPASTTVRYVEWDISALGAGAHELVIRYAMGTTPERPMKIEVNGVVVAASYALPRLSGMGWTTYADSAPLQVTLNAGANKVRATSATGNPRLDYLQVTPLVTSTPIETWRQAKFGTTSNTGNAADDADPNHNGLINLLEYALGGDPVGNTTGLGILPQAERSAGDKLQIRFTRYPDRSDLRLTAQAADALNGPWTDLAVSSAGAAFAPTGTATAAESGTGNTRSVTVTDLYPMGDPAHPKRFMRLKAEKYPNS
jgi:chitodextrinase